jgi:putative oxidoreductase
MATPGQEPRPVVLGLGPVYDRTRDLSWPLVRVTAGGFLLIHGILKLTMNSIAGFAANSMARRGIEPAVPAAYAVFFLETVGAACIMLGLFTRPFAAMLFVEFLVIIFVAHWGGGFAGFS